MEQWKTSLPCREAGGLVLAYMGPGEPPRLPKFPFFLAPPERRWVTKIHHDCNYLQGNEGNIDPQHLSYLHRFLDPRQAIDARSNSLLVRDTAPPGRIALGASWSMRMRQWKILLIRSNSLHLMVRQRTDVMRVIMAAVRSTGLPRRGVCRRRR